MRQQKWKIVTTFMIFFLISMAALSSQAQAQVPVKYGDSNNDVRDLQYRLKTLNLYSGPIDAHYGKGTKAAVIAFQKKYGANPDGMTGPATWKKLKKYSLSKYEVDMVSKVIYSEARGESYKGQVAVGAVVMNRIQSSGFPNTAEGVIFQKNAFTAVSDGQYKLTPNQTAYNAALDAVRGWDPTKEALYYFNPKIASSKWIFSRPRTTKIGNHVFAR